MARTSLVHLDLDITYSWGVPRLAKPSSLLLDVGHLRNIRWSMDNDQATWLYYNRVAGMHASAQEHLIPEAMFVGPETPGEAVSAAKLLAKAAAAGQRIYVITQANAAAALPRLALGAETLEDIRAAVAAGKEVTVHERLMQVNGWSGAGYLVLDPETGAGAYLISGGANGGKLFAAVLGILSGLLVGAYLNVLVGAIITGGTLAVGWPLVLAGLLIAACYLLINMAIDTLMDDAAYACYQGGATVGLGVAWVWAPTPQAGFTKAFQVLLIALGYVMVDGTNLPGCLS